MKDYADELNYLAQICDEFMALVNQCDRRHFDTIRPAIETVHRINATLAIYREIQTPVRFQFRSPQHEAALRGLTASQISSVELLRDEFLKLGILDAPPKE